MGGKTRSETAAAFLKRVSGKGKDREAKEWTEKTLELSQNQHLALSVLGVVSIVVVPGGAFHYSLSPHLMMRRETLDWVDEALSNTQKYVRELRAKVVERDIEVAKKVTKQEETDGEDSTDSTAS